MVLKDMQHNRQRVSNVFHQMGFILSARKVQEKDITSGLNQSRAVWWTRGDGERAGLFEVVGKTKYRRFKGGLPGSETPHIFFLNRIDHQK